MPRVDVWDIPEDKPTQPLWIGYRQGLTDKYDLGKKLGEGGFGSVRIVVLKSTGAEFACKSICKRLDVPNLAPIKQQQHLENIKREVLILRKLRGTLNVVHLACVYEDESHVHIIMEYCRGGELFHKMGRRHYSERTVASYMRAVLRTLAQCHAQRILHRDIKPGNFMLLSEAEDSPLKAIDFGLAVFFDPSQLPRTDLGLEGTPWYMAPEVLSSCVEPASDVWAAGVIAYQLLSGRFPFDDWAHPDAPALSLVWRSILSESPSFKGSSWGEVSEAAKDFCRKLLDKDVSLRPSAREALSHPWLQQGNTQQRLQGTQLTQVVQRLQRHSQQNVFKKTVLDMMANELLARHMARTQQQQQQCQYPGPQQVMSSHLSGSPDVASAAATTAAAGSSPGGLRVLPGLPGLPGVACVTPQYAEGSVHRRQQLLRLVPPSKRSSSLDLGSSGGTQEHAAAAAAAVPDLAAAAAEGQGVAPVWPGVGVGSAGRLEGTWHGAGVGWAAGGSSLGCLDGSVRGRRGALGSLRGATSALEALRRARERAAAATDVISASAEGGGIIADGSMTAAAAVGVPVLPPLSTAGGVGAAAAEQGEDGSVRYRGPVKDPGSASLWDLQFMAGRLAMEGSAHGNAYTQRLLQAGSTHAGKSAAAAAMLQAAAAPTLQQQPVESGASPHTQSSSQQQQQQQQQVQQQATGSPLMASAAAAHRLEGTWHGPSRSASINVATVVRQNAQSAHRADLDRDLSWHGRTSHMRLLSEQGSLSGSKQASEHEEFLRFLEAAKRQRQEQRKVARLVLEGSTHGGVQYFLPARGTSSIAVVMGADAGAVTAGPGSLAEGDDSTDDDDDESSLGVASKASRSSRPSTPGSSGHGSTAAAAAAAGGPPPRPGILGKLKHSLKQILTPAEPSRNSSSSCDLNALARTSWRPGLATQDPVRGPAPTTAQGAGGAATAGPLRDPSPLGTPKGGLNTAATPPTAAAAAGASNSSGSSAVGGVPGGPHVQLAEQILELQSPGWQASLESRRRGQGAYAALMAATSMATEGDGDGIGPAAAAAMGAPAVAAEQGVGGARGMQQRQQAAPQQVGITEPPLPARQGISMASKHHAASGAVPALQPGLTPLEQALQVQTQQQTKQQQEANSTMLLRPGSTSQQQQQQQQQESPVDAVGMQQGLLPLPGPKAQVQSPPPAAASWQPPASNSMLPLPRSSQQQQQQHRVGADLLPMPGTSAAQRQLVAALEPAIDGSSGSMLPAPGKPSAAGAHVQQQQQQQETAPAATDAAATRPLSVGHQGHAPCWTFDCARGADGGDASILPMPGGSGTGPGQPVPPAAAAVAGARSPFADEAAGIGLSAPKGSAAAGHGNVAAPAATSAGPLPPPLSPAPPPPGLPPSGGSGSLVPALAEVSRLLDLLSGSSPELVTVERLQAGLAGLGYLLEPSEVLELACSLGYGVEGAQGVPLSQLAASQLDWEELQVNHREEWLQCLRATFDAMDADRDGRLRPSEILEALKDKLPEAEVNAAIEDVLLEAAADEDEGLDFAAFKMLASLAADGALPLDQYDSRLGAAGGGQEEGGSGHGQGAALQLLRTVPEADQ